MRQLRAALFWLMVNLSPSLYAQPIMTEPLEAVKAYEPGLWNLGTGGLAPELWQNSTADKARDLLHLIARADNSRRHPLARQIIRRVLLSEAVSPAGNVRDLDMFRRARLQALTVFARTDEFTQMLAHYPALQMQPDLAIDLALHRGDIAMACKLTDTITENRAALKWVKIRGFCHIVRDELAAAELTLNLLSGKESELMSYMSLMRYMLGLSESLPSHPFDTPLLRVMASHAGLLAPSAFRAAQFALEIDLSLDVRWQNFYRGSTYMNDTQIHDFFTQLALMAPAPLPVFDLEAALMDDSAVSTARLYIVLYLGVFPEVRKRILAVLLLRAEKAGALARFVDFLSPYESNSTGNDVAQACLTHTAILLEQKPGMNMAADAESSEAVRQLLDHIDDSAVRNALSEILLYTALLLMEPDMKTLERAQLMGVLEVLRAAGQTDYAAQLRTCYG